ncbi:MAG: hypothetical protein DSO04_03045 [Hadesarchaea archaeon]|nr:MAG: hypothetical protein DSO04_03045 [Hadesarchaea archaeon]
METLKWITLVVLLGCYSLAISRRIRLSLVSLSSALLLLLAGALSPEEAVNSIRWSVLGLYWGFLLLSLLFSESGLPSLLAHRLLRASRSPGGALLLLCSLTALFSAFLENVGVVLIMAPIAFELSRRIRTSPFLPLISVALSSNIVTTVSMISDPPALLLASQTGMSFTDFYLFRGRPGLGVLSALGAAAGLLSLHLLHFRRLGGRVRVEEREGRVDYSPLVLFAAGILLLSLDPRLHLGPGLIGVGVGVGSLLLGGRRAKRMIREFDWDSLLFLLGIFVVIGAAQNVGLLEDLARELAGLRLGPSATLALLVWLSVALSSFIDNVPLTVLMLPVCADLGSSLGMDPLPLMYGMLVGIGMGGNVTPVGATAQVFACRMLERRGHRVRLTEYLKLSLPLTLVSVSVTHLLLQLLWL